MYYDYSKIVSYNAMLNFIIGERGVGKTYGLTKLVTNKFIKKGEEFAYIRRYRTELSKAVPKFFDAVKSNNEFPDHSLRTNGNKFYIDDKVARLFYDTCYISRLKIYQLFKSYYYYF